MDELRALWAVPAVRAGAIVAAAIAAAAVVELLLRPAVELLTRRTKTDFDDIVLAAIRRPVFLSFILVGLAWAADELPLTPRLVHVTDSALRTIGIIIWTGAAFRVGIALLEALSRRSTDSSIVQPRTLPVFDMLVKLVVSGGAIYFMFLAWDIDLTAWLASAGIIGIAIGFAAKDTLANLFSGIFIVADAPYKIGDWIVLDGGLRGQVTKIGMRSTRILTRDDIEITIPNAVIGASKIVNETGGPHVKQRVGIAVDVAYTSDIDLVRTVLLQVTAGAAHLASQPEAQVRFREFGGSGLKFELLVWLDDAGMRGQVVDDLNCKIYKAFAAHHIEIPYSKHDLYIKQFPGRAGAPASTDDA
ncbi:MAG: mechanosensitive ion channel family protein [Kofleriaceae bacterium]